MSKQKNEFDQPLGDLVANWRARSMPAKLPMQGRFCTLEAMDIDKHSAKLYEALLMNNQGQSWTYLPYGPFDSLAEFQVWLNEILLEQDTQLYAINDIHTLQPLGVAGYLRINSAHGVIEVGHLHFSNLLKKTPAATEAMYLMMKHVFDDLAYRRYEWKCNALNQASYHAALRLGFTFEGIFRQSNVFKNRNRDTAWFSIINSEWPDVKQRFERWLDPSNFDANGKQKVTLNRI